MIQHFFSATLAQSKWGSRLLGNRLSILAYHSIAEDGDDPVAITPSVFGVQMAWLRESGFQVIALEEATRRLEQRADLRRCLVLTFDDGYADFLEHAAPVLEQYGFTATLFVVTGKVEQQSDWHHISPPRPLLSLSDLRDLRQRGFCIGSHSMRHVYLPRLPIQELDAELQQSRSFLADQVGMTTFVFSYPYGAFGDRERQAVSRAGYVCACGSRGIWGNGYESDRFGLSRFEIQRRYSLQEFKTIVCSTIKWPLLAWPRPGGVVQTMPLPTHLSTLAEWPSDLIETRLTAAIARLDAWLETMRGPDGYGGPVAHWWQDCLQFTGAGLDWRYEGIISGYLNLYRKTGDEQWLAKARQAGDDLVRGQLPTGNFRNSNFEMNPYAGGTPHEAACDMALLRLARVLQEQGDPAWQTYAITAEDNLQNYILGVLWDKEKRFFWNDRDDASFVPNKVATIIEALFAWASLSGNDEPVERYAIPMLEAILQCQVRAPGERLDGAIDQGRVGQKGTGRFFPFYIARCIPALVQGYALTRQGRYLEAAQSAMSFILRERLPDGSFPQVIYRHGRTNRYPQWIAGVGDILRAVELMREQGMDASPEVTLEWLLNGQLPGGGIRTAHGFASSGSQHPPHRLPDFRDILPVCGWIDKAFRYLTNLVQSDMRLRVANIGEVEIACVFRGRMMRYHENARAIELWQGKERHYRWQKGSAWAETCVASRGGAK